MNLGDTNNQPRRLRLHSIVSTTTFSARVGAVGPYFRDLWGRREFAWFMAMGNLRARNASTALGLVWWVINPLLGKPLSLPLPYGIITP